MMNLTLILADIRVSIECVSSFNHFFSQYESRSDGHADINVSVSEEEIYERHGRFPDINKRSAESYLIYEKICDQLPCFDAFMLHAATLEYDGKAYAFCAVSGTGKSTHAELWHSFLGDECHYINGDKPIIRIINGVPAAYGTPWNGKERRGSNICAPLSGICFLVRSKAPSIRKIEPKEGIFRLLAAVHPPKDHTLDDQFYRSIGNVVENVPMYELACDISYSSAKLSFETMTGKTIKSINIQEVK